MTSAFTNVLIRIRINFTKICIGSIILLMACLVILNPVYAAKNDDNATRDLTDLDL
jgi:hypothetical protein